MMTINDHAQPVNMWIGTAQSIVMPFVYAVLANVRSGLRSTISVLSIASILVLSPGCILWPPPPPLPTIPGPEATDLVEGLHGYLVTPDRLESGSTIRVVALPSMNEHTIAPIRYVHGLSGPDREGRIAFIQAMLETSVVKIINVDGKHECEITRVPSIAAGGRHPWLDPGIGDYISISAVGGHVAFIRDLLRHQMPRTFTQVGTLEIWDVEPATKLCAEPGAVNWGLSWFPDGSRVAYVQFLPRAQVPMPADDATFGGIGKTKFEGWSDVPAIVTFDIETRNSTVIGLGKHPVVSADGHKILVRDLRGKLCAIDVTTGKYSTVEPPGIYGQVLACVGDLILYQGQLTQGQPVRRSPYGSFRAGIQMLPIKVCDLSTGEFQTIMEAVDPRHQVSFGAKD